MDPGSTQSVLVKINHSIAGRLGREMLPETFLPSVLPAVTGGATLEDRS
jgi:hypothetical protein